MKATIERGNLIIIIPLHKPRPSASGKTLLIASTRGTRKTAAQFDGKTVCVLANAFVYPDSPEAE